MDIYLKRKRGKIVLLVVAVIIGIASLLYTNWLTEKMAREERNKVELWAEAIKRFADSGNITGSSTNFQGLNTLYLTLITTIVEQNTTIPIIVLNQDSSFNLDANISYKHDKRDQILSRELKKMKDYSAPIPIKLSEETTQYLYFRESNILRNLRYYPFVQLIVIVIFILVAYFAFSTSQKAEQNQVWVGMSKETAHQLGTPISSLMAWIEILKLQDIDENLVNEFEKDTRRLEKIAERFSKIGSKPELSQQNLIEVLISAINYIKTRSSDKVKYETSFNEGDFIVIPLNAALFSWVIENLCKNAIDAMDNNGKITIKLKEKDNVINIDISDTGKGIHKSQHKTVFNPGYSTKKRGWGLGLSLAKRIIENYHNGKIFIKSSEIGKGSIFRIVLNK